jgi:hypothetical protein
MELDSIVTARKSLAVKAPRAALFTRMMPLASTGVVAVTRLTLADRPAARCW